MRWVVFQKKAVEVGDWGLGVRWLAGRVGGRVSD